MVRHISVRILSYFKEEMMVQEDLIYLEKKKNEKRNKSRQVSRLYNRLTCIISRLIDDSQLVCTTENGTFTEVDL